MAARKRSVGLGRALRDELRRIETLLEAWSGTPQPDKEVTDRILALQKQRITLLQALEQLTAAGRRAGPIEFVFVDDWRQAVE